MDVIYRRGRATAAEVLEDIPDPPSYSAVRAMLRLLEEKGHVRHEQDGPRYVFLPIRHTAIAPANRRSRMSSEPFSTDPRRRRSPPFSTTAENSATPSSIGSRR